MGPDISVELSTASGLLFPSRDVRFDSIVRALSEPDAGPGADNLVTNEDSFTRICGEIERKVVPEEVYIGVGPDQNFTYIAHARPSLAFIVDYRRRNLLLHLFHQALFALSRDRIAYLSRLTARRPNRPAGRNRPPRNWWNRSTARRWIVDFWRRPRRKSRGFSGLWASSENPNGPRWRRSARNWRGRG